MIFADCTTDDAMAESTPTIDPTAFYNALWNTSEHGMYALEVVDAGADFRFTAFNQVYADNSPLAIETLQGKRLSEALSSDVVAVHQQHYQQCVQTQQVISFEEKLCVGDRTTYWQRTVYPLISPLGNVHQLVVTSLEVTEHRRMAVLAEAQQTLQQVINTVPAAIFWKDCNSHYLGCNQTFASIAGKDTVEEIVGKTDYDLAWKKEESDWFVTCDRRVMKANQPELDIIEPQLQSGGRQAWIKTSKIPLHDEKGRVSGLVGIIEDITDRKEIRDTRTRLLAILEATPDIISITDVDGNHCYLNQAGQHTFNLSPEQIECLHLSDLTPPVVADMWLNKALPTAAKYGNWSGESTIRDGNGQDIPVSHVIICHKSEAGEVRHFSSIMRDISDRKAAEAILTQQSTELSQTVAELKKTQAQIIQSEKMSSLGHMVAGVAHEINNPVNFIHGNLQPASVYTQELIDLIDLYKRSYPNPTEEIEETLDDIDLDFVRQDLPKLLTSMTVGTQRIREIVLSLRNFSRLDEAEIKTVDIHEGIDSTLVILNHRLKSDNENQAISVVKQYGELPLVDCYPSQLNQVLMNILANAIEALEEEKEPKIAIATDVSKNTINIRIKDNGPGIPQAVQSQILNPFFTTKPIGKGTGMGMSISYQIITEKHGGQLRFTSQVGKGTEFCITIPVHQPNAT